MIVVDTNVITYLFIRGERSEAMDRLLAQDSEWIAPRLWLDEFLNVLTTYGRNKMLDASQSTEILNDALTLMQEATYDIRPERVLAAARRTGCSAYDSQYIALAEDLGLPLYTCDQGILKRYPELANEPA